MVVALGSTSVWILWIGGILARDGLWVTLELSGAMPLIALAGVSLCWVEELREFESLMGINGGIGWVGVEVVCLDRFKTAVST